MKVEYKDKHGYKIIKNFYSSCLKFLLIKNKSFKLKIILYLILNHFKGNEIFP
jgi:hypothetical protein